MSFLSLFVLFSSAGNCHVVAGDRILSDDLARAIPVFAGLPSGLPIGYSPAPGVRRILREDELLRIARFNGIQATHIPPVCFAMPMRPADPVAVVEAMRSSLGSTEAKIELSDVRPPLVPEGKLVFPRATLITPPTTAKDHIVFWHGYIEYAAGRRYPITARVELSQSLTRVVAASNLTPRTPIEASALRLETVQGFPSQVEVVQSIEQLVGKTARHVILAGQPISPVDVTAMPAVLKGDRVHVEVRNGPAHLSLEGEAETAGYAGQMIQIRNLSTGKRFPAKVESAGLVVVLPKGGAR